MDVDQGAHEDEGQGMDVDAEEFTTADSRLQATRELLAAFYPPIVLNPLWTSPDYVTGD